MVVVICLFPNPISLSDSFIRVMFWGLGVVFIQPAASPSVIMYVPRGIQYLNDSPNLFVERLNVIGPIIVKLKSESWFSPSSHTPFPLLSLNLYIFRLPHILSGNVVVVVVVVVVVS